MALGRESNIAQVEIYNFEILAYINAKKNFSLICLTGSAICKSISVPFAISRSLKISGSETE